MNKKQFYRFLVSSLLYFLLYVFILEFALFLEDAILQSIVDSFDLNNDTIFSGIENTEEKEFWFNFLIGRSGFYLFSVFFFAPITSAFLTLITQLIYKYKDKTVSKKKNIMDFILLLGLCTMLHAIDVFISTKSHSILVSSLHDCKYWFFQIVGGTQKILLLCELLILVYFVWKNTFRGEKCANTFVSKNDRQCN